MTKHQNAKKRQSDINRKRPIIFYDSNYQKINLKVNL